MKKYDWGFVFKCGTYLLLIVVIVWIFASWVNIINHNSTDCNYWTFNFFNLWG